MRKSPISIQFSWLLAFFLTSICGPHSVFADEPVFGEPESNSSSDLPYLTPEEAVEHTPLSGEGFQTTVFGEEAVVPPWNRRSFQAWQVGLQLNFPQPDERAVLPIAALYWWNHPESNEQIFYGTSVIVYNDILFAKALAPSSPFEGLLTFNSNTIPVAQREVIDGRKFTPGSLYWGYIRPGFGLGYRDQIGPYNDNMFALDFIVEPGFLYFGRSNSTGSSFVTPKDTFEIRTRMELRYDRLSRNVLNMLHEGFATGANLIYGHRANWDRWGSNGQESGDGQDYIEFNGYLIGGGRVPFVDSNRHRLLGYLHAGVGHNLDRFSAERVGGGPNPKGDAYNETWRPILPGASLLEFYPENYAIFAGEYRWEATFFTYLSAAGGVGTLNPLRQTDQGVRRRQTVYPFIGAQVVTGFFGDTRLTLSYNHNWGVVRDGKFGGNEIMAWIAGQW